MVRNAVRRGEYAPPTLVAASGAVIAASASAGSDASASRADAKFERFKDEFGGVESEEAERTREERERRRNFWVTFVHAAFASVTIIASLISIRLSSWGISQAAFGIPIGTAPYTVRQRQKLNRAATLRETMNRFRNIVSRLTVQNDRLHEQNDELRKQVNKMKKVEESLSAIVARQGQDVDTFCAAVKENGRVQRRMKRYLKAAAMQDIVTMVIRSDRDLNEEFGDDEIDLLVHRMLLHPDLKDRDMDELREALLSARNRSITSIMCKANEIFDMAMAARRT